MTAKGNTKRQSTQHTHDSGIKHYNLSVYNDQQPSEGGGKRFIPHDLRKMALQEATDIRSKQAGGITVMCRGCMTMFPISYCRQCKKRVFEEADWYCAECRAKGGLITA